MCHNLGGGQSTALEMARCTIVGKNNLTLHTLKSQLKHTISTNKHNLHNNNNNNNNNNRKKMEMKGRTRYIMTVMKMSTHNHRSQTWKSNPSTVLIRCFQNYYHDLEINPRTISRTKT
jgi:hypothetical protein